MCMCALWSSTFVSSSRQSVANKEAACSFRLSGWICLYTWHRFPLITPAYTQTSFQCSRGSLLVILSLSVQMNGYFAFTPPVYETLAATLFNCATSVIHWFLKGLCTLCFGKGYVLSVLHAKQVLWQEPYTNEAETDESESHRRGLGVAPKDGRLSLWLF